MHRRHSFIKWLQKNAHYEDVAKIERMWHSGVWWKKLHACGVSFAHGALEFLAGKIGGHPRLGVEETRKLSSYLGDDGGEITEQLIMELVPDFGEGDFFEATEAFFSGNLQWTIEAIDRHFFHAKDARPLLSNLQNRNRLLIQLRVLVDGGEIDPIVDSVKTNSNELVKNIPIIFLIRAIKPPQPLYPKPLVWEDYYP